MKYQHDCESCVPLGECRDADLYFCRQGGRLPTVLARYSDDGSDYASGWPSRLPLLREAHRRAVERGLMP